MKTYVLPLLAFITSLVQAQQLLNLTPISNKTVLIKLDEGEKDLTDFSEYFIYDAPNATYYGQIEEEQALITSNYTIQSTNDPVYENPQLPEKVFFKAKEEKGLFEYYIYLSFPTAMIEGASYTISTVNLNTEDSYTFTANADENTSPAIHINQIGMLPISGKKYAYVSQWLGKTDGEISNDEDYSALEGATCSVVRTSDGEVVYSGFGSSGLSFKQDITETGFVYFLANPFWTRSRTWEFDFSALGTSIETDPNEEYKIVIEGIGSSHPFKIAPNSYDDLVRLLASGLYHQRSGIDRGQPFSSLPKPVDHFPGIDGFEITYSNYRRLDNQVGDSESFEQLPLQATSFVNPTNAQPWMESPDDFPWGSGGHFDAGDHDVYIEHLAIPLFGSLVYLLAPDGFIDGQFNIPENDNEVPDILDEIRWTLDFFRRTKGPTGGVCGGKETTGYFGPSWNNGSGDSSSEQMWYVYKEDAFVSFVYAAAASQYALALQQAGDPNDEAQLYIDDAITAYEWGVENKVSSDQDIPTKGLPTQGFFPDGQLMAASMLYAVTGAQPYLDYYISNTSVTSATDGLYVFEGYDEQFATWAFTLIPEDRWDNFSTAIDLQNIQKEATIRWANTWGLDDQNSFPYRNIMSRFNPPLGGNTGSTPQVFPQIMAYHHTEDQNILDAILASNDMNLGGNSENRVYITGSETIGAERASSDILHNDNFQYGGENIPGIPLYGLWTTNAYYFQSSPPAEEWPHYETHTNSRIYLGHTEFTVHQNSIQTLATYGYLNSILNPEASTLSVNNSVQPSETTFSVFPNPTTGSFVVSWSDPTFHPSFTLYDLLGREIAIAYDASTTDQPNREGGAYPLGSAHLTVTTSPLSSGMYILEGSHNGAKRTVKIIID